MKKLMLSVFIVMSISISCSTTDKTPEEIAVFIFEKCFNGEYEKTYEYLRLKDGTQLTENEHKKYKEETSEYFNDFISNHGNLIQIEVEGSGPIDDNTYGVRLNISFEDGYSEDENLRLKKFDNNWYFTVRK